MLMRYQDGLYYPDFSIHVPLNLEEWMVMFNLIKPPWPSRMENNLKIFHSKVLRLQQEIMLSGEIIFPTRLLFQYIKALKKSEKLRAFIFPKMTDLIPFLDNNEKSAVYTE